MMRRETVEAFTTPRPFQPFEIRLVDGQRFKIKSVEHFLLGRYHLAVLNTRGIVVTLSLGLISTITPIQARRRSG
jgi:hypothetical protein